MDSLLEGIGEWIRQGLISGIMTVLQTMFDLVNMQVGVAAVQAGATPESWNSGVFSMIRTLSETVITPIAGIILTFVLLIESETSLTRNLADLLIDRVRVFSSGKIEVDWKASAQPRAPKSELVVAMPSWS